MLFQTVLLMTLLLLSSGAAVGECQEPGFPSLLKRKHLDAISSLKILLSLFTKLFDTASDAATIIAATATSKSLISLKLLKGFILSIFIKELT